MNVGASRVSKVSGQISGYLTERFSQRPTEVHELMPTCVCSRPGRGYKTRDEGDVLAGKSGCSWSGRALKFHLHRNTSPIAVLDRGYTEVCSAFSSMNKADKNIKPV